jgi:hypothetical protein
VLLCFERMLLTSRLRRSILPFALSNNITLVRLPVHLSVGDVISIRLITNSAPR